MNTYIYTYPTSSTLPLQPFPLTPTYVVRFLFLLDAVHDPVLLQAGEEGVASLPAMGTGYAVGSFKGAVWRWGWVCGGIVCLWGRGEEAHLR